MFSQECYYEYANQAYSEGIAQITFCYIQKKNTTLSDEYKVPLKIYKIIQL